MTKRVPMVLLIIAVLTVAAPYADAQVANNSFYQYNYTIQTYPDANGNWPLVHNNDSSSPYPNSLEFRYQVVLSCPNGTANLMNSLTMAFPIPAGATTASYILGGNASQIVSLPAPCLAVPSTQQLWQISVSKMNCTNNTKPFSIFTALDTAFSPTDVVGIGLVTAAGCAAGQILGPACPTNVSTQQSTIITSSNGLEVQVDYGSNGLPTSATVISSSADSTVTAVPLTSPLLLCTNSSTNYPTNCLPIVSYGSASGNTMTFDPGGCCNVNTSYPSPGVALVICTPGTTSGIGCCNTTCACLTAAQRATLKAAKTPCTN
jgi:hypothetical protein